MIVVGSTTASWKCNGVSEMAWLDEAERMRDDAGACGEEVKFFAALETDARGLAPFTKLLERLAALGGEYWTFSIDDTSEAINANNRILRICTGRNLVSEYVVRSGAEWALFLDTDVRPEHNSLSRLLEIDWPIVGGDVPRYAMGGPVIENHPHRIWLEGGLIWPRFTPWGSPFGFEVQKHWNTAGFLLVHRELVRRLRWRGDPDAGMTDDPCYATDALALGWPTLVRHDVIGTHVDPLVPIEARDGVDLRIYR